jgi:hypothetical protein
LDAGRASKKAELEVSDRSKSDTDYPQTHCDTTVTRRGRSLKLHLQEGIKDPLESTDEHP